ncbi:MAG: glycosyltransferase, partial [Kiritimatiellae bacterium]|nr:glycosyltransferase [Kiritimatiellia bacterium]
SFTENFGATVVDALAHGKPAIASKFTPWKELDECKCGWWVSNKPDELATAIRAMAALAPEERAAMGEKGRAIAAAKYSWQAVAAALERKYKEIARR